MSKANGAIENNDTYLQHVSLKNYKSIKDAEINFKPGLNIIIGKNASGKTNFINGLNAILTSDYRKFSDSSSAITARFKNDKIEIEIQPQENHQLEDNFNFQPNRNISLKINDKKDNFNDFHDVIFYTLSKKGFTFKEVYIQYGISYKETDSFIGNPFSFIFMDNGKGSRAWVDDIIRSIDTRFVHSFFILLYDNIFIIYNKIIQDQDHDFEQQFKDEIISFSDECFAKINLLVPHYCPIQKIQLNRDFKIIYDSMTPKLMISNIYLEFLIDNTWLTFKFLSDGTKRLFQIISEILSINYFKDVNSDNLNVILLEEPELGIHPHQLHQLMQFIKEQSREKQIILTTHSPQVLDVLGPDELDRVIICHHDSKKGTQLSHLTEKEMNKAKKYMKEDFLSDYWRFSDLEPA